MKKTNYIFISLELISSSLVLQSCKDEKNAAEAISEVPKEIAVEILCARNFSKKIINLM